jgi:hypothetical protein
MPSYLLTITTKPTSEVRRHDDDGVVVRGLLLDECFELGLRNVGVDFLRHQDHAVANVVGDVGSDVFLDQLRPGTEVRDQDGVVGECCRHEDAPLRLGEGRYCLDGQTTGRYLDLAAGDHATALAQMVLDQRPAELDLVVGPVLRQQLGDLQALLMPGPERHEHFLI